MRHHCLTGVIIGAVPGLLGAAPTQSEPATKLQAASIGTGSVLEMIAILTGVILLILILGWLIKRVGHFPTAGKGMVRILGGVSLGPRERAVVLEAGDKRLLVGVAPGRIQTLCLLDKDAGEVDVSDVDSDKRFSAQLDTQMQDGSK